MVSAWYMDDGEDDQRNPHQFDPPRPVPLEELERLKVIYREVEIDAIDTYKKEGGELHRIRKERGYCGEDTLTISDKLSDYEEKIKTFYIEHLHTDEEIIVVIDGVGYFDFRDAEDKWIRLTLTKGDLMVLPGGIYHRFTTDINNFVVAERHFLGEPIRKAYHRPADDMEERQKYLQSIKA